MNYSVWDELEVSKILDTHIPADGVGTEREKLRTILHKEICKLINDARKEERDNALEQQERNQDSE